MPSIRPVILSGGSGTRLWPLSTPRLPKQFAPLLPGDSLFARAIKRLAGRPGVRDPIIVTGRAHLDLAISAARDNGIEPHLTVVEPQGRNTAPASIAAALTADATDTLVILPSDHLIADGEGFADRVLSSVALTEQGRIITFGVKPTRPDTGYGYIEMGESVDGGFVVSRFKEKPDEEEARRLAGDGMHLWNCGMFMTNARALIDQAGVHCPDVLEGVANAMRQPVEGVLELGEEFTTIQKISLDHAVMEKTTAAIVVPIEVGWDDVGSFNALWEVTDRDEDGNALSGRVVLAGVTGSFIRATFRTVAVAGMEDVVVIETPDAVLVVPRDRSQMVRDIFGQLDPD